MIHEKKLSVIKDIVPLLEKIAKSGKALIIIAEDIEEMRSAHLSSINSVVPYNALLSRRLGLVIEGRRC